MCLGDMIRMPGYQNREESDIVGVTPAALGISGTADLLGFLHICSWDCRYKSLLLTLVHQKCALMCNVPAK